MSSDQAKDDFDGDPRGHNAACAVMRGREFPRANRLHGAIIQPHADSLNDLDLRSAAVRANQDAQGDFALQLRFARLVRILRVGAVDAGWQCHAGPIGKSRVALAAWPVDWSVTHGFSTAVANRVGISRTRGISVLAHPREPNLVHRSEHGWRGGIENRWRYGHNRFSLGWQRRPHNLDRRDWHKVAGSSWYRRSSSAATSPVAGMEAAEHLQKAARRWENPRYFGS